MQALVTCTMTATREKPVPGCGFMVLCPNWWEKHLACLDPSTLAACHASALLHPTP